MHVLKGHKHIDMFPAFAMHDESLKKLWTIQEACELEREGAISGTLQPRSEEVELSGKFFGVSPGADVYR
jgi:hypothetical protein